MNGTDAHPPTRRPDSSGFFRRVARLSAQRLAAQAVTLLAGIGLVSVGLILSGHTALLSSLSQRSLQLALEMLMLLSVWTVSSPAALRLRRNTASLSVDTLATLALAFVQTCTLLTVHLTAGQTLLTQALLVISASAAQTSHEAERPAADRRHIDRLDWGEQP